MRIFCFFLLFPSFLLAADKSRFDNGNLGIGVGNDQIEQRLDVNGAIKLGSSDTKADGSLRFNSDQFEVIENNLWIKLITQTDLDDLDIQNITSVTASVVDEETILTFNFSDGTSLQTNLGSINGTDGVDGVNGTDGVDGMNGTNGATWITGSDDPQAEEGNNSDLYLNTTSFEIYLKSNDTWGSLGNIKGADGEDGEATDLTDVDIDGGSIDNTTIGSNTPSNATFENTTINEILNLQAISSLPENPNVGDIVHLTNKSLWIYMSNGWRAILEPDSQSHTEYDGVDDRYYTSDEDLKINGSQTWCVEVSFNEVPLEYREFLGDYTTQLPRSGIHYGVSVYDGEERIQFLVGADNGEDGSGSFNSRGQTDIEADIWYELVGVLDVDNLTVELFIDGKSQGVTAIDSFGVGADNFVMASREAGDRFANIKLRNIEIYSGAATNPSAWVPGDSTSLSGTTLVMQSVDGSGENDQGIVFTQGGDPETVE